MVNLTERQKALHAWMLAKRRPIGKCLHANGQHIHLSGTKGYLGNVHIKSLEALLSAGWVRTETVESYRVEWLVFRAVEVADA